MLLPTVGVCDIATNFSSVMGEVILALRAWPTPAMLGCSTACPKCKHEFSCCPPASACCAQRRSMHVLSGGGLTVAPLSAPPTSHHNHHHHHHHHALSPTPAFGWDKSVTVTTSCCGVVSPCPSPQASPSAPLAFIIPPLAKQQLPSSSSTTCLLPASPAPSLPPVYVRPESELQRLAEVERALRQSGWYYEGISYKTSDELLRPTRVGTFLVRNSADPRYLFALSVQTDRGPTSVRLCYAAGLFRLEARSGLQADMPQFQGVVELVEYYVRQFLYSAQVWVDPQGRFYSAIVLREPLRRKPPALKHLARLAVRRAVQQADGVRQPSSPSPNVPQLSSLPSSPSVQQVSTPPAEKLGLPQSLERYLAEYPYSV